ncbi:L-dopachrome tautomerase-related protein [Gluconacetobacter sacchari]|uniref:L-dopachrome tautomerase-related protein n=1 Tax=Gluconacetobacter sacchari TaxID=92759 RepID=UPI0039B5408C
MRSSRARFASCCLVLAAGLVSGVACAAPGVPADSVDHGYAPSSNVTEIGRFRDAEPSGIVVLPDGRLLLSFPASAQAHSGPVLAVWRDGVLTPFPDAATQRALRSPLGVTLDGRGRVWVVDEGWVAGSDAPHAPMLVGISPGMGKEGEGRVFARFALTAPVTRPDSHVNDVRVDLTHGSAGTAFLSDTSLAGHPALIAVDLASGRARRLLADHPSVSPDKGFAIELDGQMAQYSATRPVMGQGGVNGIALSADSSRLYWSPQSSRRLYSAPTAVLADPAATAQAVRAAVRDEGETASSDGLLAAPDGGLYITDEERHAILYRDSQGRLQMIAHDPRMIAPDSMALDGNSLLATIGQWPRLPVFHDGRDLQERPYLLIRIALPAGLRHS